MKPSSPWQAAVAESATWVDNPSPIVELIEGRLDGVLSESGFEWDYGPVSVLIPLRQANSKSGSLSCATSSEVRHPRGPDAISFKPDVNMNPLRSNGWIRRAREPILRERRGRSEPTTHPTWSPARHRSH
jgi:hypothetical protein